MFTLGITGGLKTGKTTVARFFEKKGAMRLDSDRIVHEALQKGGGCYAKVKKAFGNEVVSSQGIDRKKLAHRVFADPRELKKLTAVIHPFVRRTIQKKIFQAAKMKKRIVVVEVPLLFEAKFDTLMDGNLVVTAAQSRQLKRAQAQKGLTPSKALKRIRAQMPLADKVRRADFIIDNNGSLTRTRNQVNLLWEKLLRKKA